METPFLRCTQPPSSSRLKMLLRDVGKTQEDCGQHGERICGRPDRTGVTVVTKTLLRISIHNLRVLFALQLLVVIHHTPLFVLNMLFPRIYCDDEPFAKRKAIAAPSSTAMIMRRVHQTNSQITTHGSTLVLP